MRARPGSPDDASSAAAASRRDRGRSRWCSLLPETQETPEPASIATSSAATTGTVRTPPAPMPMPTTPMPDADDRPEDVIRRNPPRDWAAPPPWLASSERRRRRRRAARVPRPPGSRIPAAASPAAPRTAWPAVIPSAEQTTSRGRARRVERGRPAAAALGDRSRQLTVAGRAAAASPGRSPSQDLGDGDEIDEEPRPPGSSPAGLRPAPRRDRTARTGSGRAAHEAYPEIKTRVGMPNVPPDRADGRVRRSPGDRRCTSCPALLGLGGSTGTAAGSPTPSVSAAADARAQPHEPPAPDAAALHDQEGRNPLEDRDGARDHDRGAARGQPDHQEPEQDQRGPADHPAGPERRPARRDRGSPRSRSARRRRARRASRRPRGSLAPLERQRGARLIEVILPASTRNVASRWSDGAPGRTTRTSAS